MKETYPLKPYMVYDRMAGSGEGAVLVFAHNVQEARKVGWPDVSNWGCDGFIYCAANYLKDSLWLYDEAKKEKLEAGIPHCIESPIVCKCCEKWGYEMNGNGYCESCAEDD